MAQKKGTPKSRIALPKSAGLRDVPCLAGLDAAALNRLAEEVPEKEYRRGQILFQQGDICEEIFVLTKGGVKIYRLSDDGRQQILRIMGAGDCFCVAPAFHQVRYPATAQCMTDVRLLSLSRVQCLFLLRGNPGLAANVITCLCHQMADMAALLETSSTRQVRRRLARFLLDLAHTRGVSRGKGVLLDSGLTHDELAACVGTAREVISRTLEQWQREGLVRLGRGRLVLLDLPRLEEILTPPSSRQNKTPIGDCSH
jgi:CRP/FNR family transcriptional regulator